MSSLLDQSRARSSRPATQPAFPSQPRLTVVPRRQRRALRLPFVLVVVLVLGAGLVGLLMLNTSLQQGAFRSAALERKAATLLDRQQDLALAVDALREPQRVSQKARLLGMVANENPVFLRLSDGKVLGRAEPARPDALAPGAALTDGGR